MFTFFCRPYFKCLYLLKYNSQYPSSITQTGAFCKMARLKKVFFCKYKHTKRMVLLINIKTYFPVNNFLFSSSFSMLF